MKNIIVSNRAPEAIGPYSQAVEVNGLIYTSGVIPVNVETGSIPEGAQNQARQAFKNICGLIEDAGGDASTIIKTTVFIKNMDDFTCINNVYKEFFAEPYPARSCVEVARLPKDVLIEIEAVALKKD